MVPAGAARRQHSGSADDLLWLAVGLPLLGRERTVRHRGQRQGLRVPLQPAVPIVEVLEAEVLLDNMRLFSDGNRSVSLGNRTVDARIEIVDLLSPVYTMQSYTEGTMESLHDFSSNSPIDRVFGGNLDRIAVSGNGSVALDLTVRFATGGPLNSRRHSC